MQVILMENVKTLGNVGETVRVSAGHARNYLIPNKLAILADDSNSKQMADYQKMLAKRVEETKKEAQELAKKLEGITLAFIKKVGGNGKLFGTVTSAEISAALEKEELEVEKRLINIESPIKNLGTFDVTAKLFSGVEARFKVRVEMDPKQEEELKKKQAAAAASKKKAAAKTEESESSAEVEAETTEEV